MFMVCMTFYYVTFHIYAVIYVLLFYSKLRWKR